MIRPFLVLALPRSRTAWLSRFLSYREWHCGHEEARHVRNMEDVQSWLKMPFTGSAETAAGPFWRIFSSQVAIVVVRRPVREVVESLMRLNLGFDQARMTHVMTRLDMKLRQIEARCPNVISVRFEDLAQEETCARVFEFCLPYKHDPAWWRFLAPINIQCSMPAMVRYFVAHKPQLDRAVGLAKQAMLQQLAVKPAAVEGVEFHVEPFAKFLEDGKQLFAEHAFEVGEPPQSFQGKNLPLHQAMEDIGALQILTARSNGRMFGYLMTEICPSREAQGRTSAVHTATFASSSIPGLGLKMQREAVRRLAERGVDEVFLRAGSRGSGPRMGTLYRRLGAEKDGEIYRLKLER